ncbi:DNA polymerase III subunit beta [Calderihabitans maritimus]|uniref:Beta sliding clamp n=1 Tax=Calderihabitans maritimus TaxID=1246530 RepID=A0A1Z5HWB9_9FIRM|nr:DNA polymerase III subunit beta [Calderihabitans maritimus]GAW93647.1 DNA polymerase III subunit beta [Calderihabitans maritimus]
MKVSCSQENLTHGVNMVQRAVSDKNTMPILGGIFLQAKENSLSFRATNLELSIECTVTAEIEEEGCVVLPARIFSELVRRLPQGPIYIESENEGTSVKIRYNQSELQLNTFNAEEFPSLPEVKEENKVILNASLLKNMIKQVAIAISKDESRPIFTGVLFEFEQSLLNMVATDTHRLALRQGQINEHYSGLEQTSFIIPGRTLMELSRLLNEEAGEVQLIFTESQAMFSFENIRVVSRLIEGTFPNYRQVIPEERNTRITIENSTFLQAVERASLFARDEDHQGFSVIKLKTTDSGLIIDGASPELGRVHEEVVASVEGEMTEIAFNAKYISDVLKVIEAEEIIMDLSGSLSPGVIKPRESDGYLYLILPVRMD